MWYVLPSIHVVIDGYVSVDAAREQYGVALTETSDIDWEETKRLRS